MTVKAHQVALLPVAAVRREGRRVVRFCVVGAANTAVTLAAFALMVGLGCPAPVASGIAFCAGAVNSYVLNRRWTFADLTAARGAGARFAAIQGFGALLSGAGVGALEALDWGHMAAECAILPFVTVTLYCLARLLVFRPASV